MCSRSGASPPPRIHKKKKSYLTMDSNGHLLEAIHRAQPKLVKQLLWSNADSNARDSQKQTALMLACLIKDTDKRMAIVELLMQKSASLDLQDESGQTASIKAVILDDLSLTSIFLKSGADVTIPDREGNSTLHYATSNGNEKITQLLVSEFRRRQKTVDDRNMRGLTPLLAACKNDHLECAKVLVLQGNANSMLRDLDNFMSPVDWMQNSSKWYSAEELEFLLPHMRKRSYYREQRKLKGTKILSDYAPMMKCDSPNMFTIKKHNDITSHSNASIDSGFSEYSYNNNGSKSMFDLPKLAPVTKAIPALRTGASRQQELPTVPRPEPYRPAAMQRRINSNLFKTRKACPNVLEPLVTTSSNGLDKLGHLNALTDFSEEPESLPNKPSAIPPLKKRPSKSSVP